jgi:hypothetical protein
VNKGPSNDYRDHVFIFTEVYQLPIGRGKKLFGNVGRAADFIIGGWSFNSATNFSSGLPFTPSLNSCSPSTDAAPCRPDKVASVKEGSRSGDRTGTGYWFQTTPIDSSTGKPTLLSTAGQTAGAWGQPQLDQFGNVGRNTLRGPKFFNTDFSLFKDFAFTETVKAQLQFQFFNVFNHVNLDLPNSCVDCSSGANITNIAYGSTMRQLTFGAKISF